MQTIYKYENNIIQPFQIALYTVYVMNNVWLSETAKYI
jgi:hypothetical protein